jgi:hypothetical protein
MNITIDNRDLAHVHIDTYQMFTGESAEEYERENMREDGREDWDTVDIEYNHAQIVEDLAHASIEILQKETAHDGIIQKITLVSSHSPRYYNYTTDSYIAEFEVHTPKLNDYIASHYDDVLKKAQSYDDYVVVGEVSKENLAHAGLCHYINNAIEAQEYNALMWEIESEVYSNNQIINPLI